MRYAIWNKTDPVITPIGEVFTAEQWMDRYPVARLDNITIVCAAGEINGAFFGTLGGMRQAYEDMGADFSGCETDQDVLEAIDAYEKRPVEPRVNTLEERQTIALEAIANRTDSETAAALNALLGEEE